MSRSQYENTFIPAQTSLLSSIQRAKQRIFSKSQKSQSQANNINNINNVNNRNNLSTYYNDENNSLNSNRQVQRVGYDKIKQERKVSATSNQIQRLAKLSKQKLQNVNISQQIKKQRQKSILSKQQKSIKPNFTSSSIINNNNNQSNTVVVNAIKLLQQKIQQLQVKNKQLQYKLNESHINQSQSQQFKIQHNKQIIQQHAPISTISRQQQQSDIKSYFVLKQQCQSLQKQNISLYQQLSKHKQYLNKNNKNQYGTKLNFIHQISQNNISNIYQTHNQSNIQSNNNQYKNKQQNNYSYKNKQQTNKQLIKSNQLSKNKQILKQIQTKLSKTQQQLIHYKSSLDNQRKKNFTILKLHQQEIIKNQQLLLEINNLKTKLKQYQQSINKNRKSISNKTQNTPIQNSTNTQLRQSVIRQKNLQLQKLIITLKEDLQNQKAYSLQKAKQVTQLERKYIQTKQTFIQLYKDLSKYHPQVINSNIKFLYQRIRKGDDTMLRSRSILSNKFGKFSNSRNTNYNNRLSQFRSKSGKKGLKMEDLNSSKRSHSRDRTNSKNSNRSINKSNYRSPYAQQSLTRKNTLKSGLSPDKHRHRSTTALNQNNKAKLSQIQQIIKQIKQVSKQIKCIKTEHRNLSVKLGSIQLDDSKQNGTNYKNQQRMNQLIEEYNQKNAKLQHLKLEKDRLALQTVPDVLL